MTAARCTECGCTDERRCTESDGALCMWSPVEGLCTACEPRVAAQALAETLAEATVVGGAGAPSAIDQLAREVLQLRQERDEARARLAILDATGADMAEARALLDVVHPYAWTAEHMGEEHYEAAGRALELVPTLLVRVSEIEGQLARAHATGDDLIAAAARTMARAARWRDVTRRFWAGRTAALAKLAEHDRAIEAVTASDLAAFVWNTTDVVAAMVVTLDDEGALELGIAGEDGPGAEPLLGLAEFVRLTVEQVIAETAGRRAVAHG